MLETRSVRRGWTRSLGLAGAGRFGGRDLLGIVARGMSRSLGEEKTGWRIHRLKKKSRIHRIHISTLQQVSEMEAFVDLKVAGGDLLEGHGLTRCSKCQVSPTGKTKLEGKGQRFSVSSLC